MKLYPRNLFEQVWASLNSKEAVFIFGARQCGKTTLLKQLIEKVGEQNSLYIDIEYPLMLETFNQGIDEVLKYLRFNRKQNKSRTYIFIDEIQYVTDFSKTIKLLVDHHSDEFKLIMTGSSSALIKYHFSESLVGRKIIFELFPLSFDEFLRFKDHSTLADAIKHDHASIPLDQYKVLEDLGEEYMTFGGYPKVSLTENISEKQRILNDLASSYILKDIKNLFRIEKIEQLNHLIRYLSVNITKEININALANEVGLNRETLKSYLNVLEECYIISKIRPFHKNLTTELKKTPKLFFIDLGIRNVLIGDFKKLDYRMDRGEIFENFVYLNLFLKKDDMTAIHYWKTKNKQEIDFIVCKNDKINAFEAKYSTTQKVSFQAFKNAYPHSECHKVCFRSPKLDKGELYGWQLA